MKLLLCGCESTSTENINICNTESSCFLKGQLWHSPLTNQHAGMHACGQDGAMKAHMPRKKLRDVPHLERMSHFDSRSRVWESAERGGEVVPHSCLVPLRFNFELAHCLSWH